MSLGAPLGSLGGHPGCLKPSRPARLACCLLHAGGGRARACDCRAAGGGRNHGMMAWFPFAHSRHHPGLLHCSALCSRSACTSCSATISDGALEHSTRFGFGWQRACALTGGTAGLSPLRLANPSCGHWHQDYLLTRRMRKWIVKNTATGRRTAHSRHSNRRDSRFADIHAAKREKPSAGQLAAHQTQQAVETLQGLLRAQARRRAAWWLRIARRCRAHRRGSRRRLSGRCGGCILLHHRAQPRSCKWVGCWAAAAAAAFQRAARKKLAAICRALARHSSPVAVASAGSCRLGASAQRGRRRSLWRWPRHGAWPCLLRLLSLLLLLLLLLRRVHAALQRRQKAQLPSQGKHVVSANQR